MKKIFVCLFMCICLAVLIVSLAGCGRNAGKVDVDGDTVKIQGPNGEEAVVSKDEWPDSELAKKLPRFTEGNIFSTVAVENTVTIYLEEVKAEDFDSYLEEVKKTYPENSYESESEEAIMYGGSGAEQITIVLHYVKADRTMNITATQTAE